MSTQPLIVRFQIAQITHLLEPKLPNGHTHLLTMCVRTHDGREFTDRSFIEKVEIHLNNTPNQIIKNPPFMSSRTSQPNSIWHDNKVHISIWLEGKEYKFEYDPIFSMEKSASHFAIATFYISETTPTFHAIATRFGSDSVIRSGETRFIGLPGLDRPCVLDSLDLAAPRQKKRRIDMDFFDLLALPNELISQIFSHLSIEDRFRARVNKRLDEIELKAKYYVPFLYIHEVSVNDPLALYKGFGHQEIKFFEEKSYTADCIKRIALNASIGSLNLNLTGFDIFHRDVYTLIKDINIKRIDIIFPTSEIAEAIMDDSYFFHFAANCESVAFNPCPKISSDFLFGVYTEMVEGSRLNYLEFANYKYKSMVKSFFKLAGIEYRHERFHSSPGFEIYGSDEDGTVYIFNGRVQFNFDKHAFESDEEFYVTITRHETQKKLDENKDEYGRIV